LSANFDASKLEVIARDECLRLRAGVVTCRHIATRPVTHDGTVDRKHPPRTASRVGGTDG